MNLQSWPLMRSKKIIFILACLGLFGGGFFYYHRYYQHMTKSDVLVYAPARDRDQLLRLFRNNWYWLVASDDYSPEAVFDNLSSSQDPRYNDTLNVNVIRDKDQLVGFTAYYMKAKNVGQLLFLAVDDSFRGKRYGQELLEYGINQLKKMGARKVDLVTRTTNLRAQKLYKRVGFKLIRDDGTGFVYFEYIP